MSSPFIGEIRMVGFNFAPRSWATCDGQLLAISQNTALFSILGVNYGGNGTSNFALPNFQGRSPMFWGQGAGLSPHFVGEASGTTSVTLTSNEMSAHNHPVSGSSTAGSLSSPSNATFASAGRGKPQYFSSFGTPAGMQSVGAAGGNQPHENMQPYLTVMFIICLAGVFPPRS